MAVQPGLTQAEAARRLAARGPSRAQSTSRSTRSIIRANTLTLFNAILAVAGAATLLFANWRDALFLGILVANTAIGIVQELRAKRALDRLAALVAPTATVVRDGEEREVAVGDVVTGDLVLARAGDQIVADGTLVGGDRVRLDESVLTGESRGVPRDSGDAVRSGSFVSEGAARYLAEAVGPDSYAERIAGEARAFRHPRSPLERGLNRLLTVLVAAMVPLGIVFAIALTSRNDLSTSEVVSTAVAGLVSLVPEGLVLLASLTAAVAAVRMASRGALVQQLNAVESLASVDVMCLDKTGTLTQPALRVDRLVEAPGTAESEVAEVLGLLAAATDDRNRTLQAIHERFPQTTPPAVRARVPFSSRRRWSAVELATGSIVFGAPELFELDGLSARVDDFQAAGRRVVAVGRSEQHLEGFDAESGPPADLHILGIAVLSEQLRDDARETVAFLRGDGVELKVLSGDAPATAGAIAEDAGIAEHGAALDGRELPVDGDELARVVGAAGVVGRIAPEGKRRVVEALRDQGHYVAMVGDGVNDVPALKAARLAIAQGSGTQMARSVADVVLVRDDFAAVAPMVHEGRTILRNVQRVARLFVTKSVFAALLILAFAVFGHDYPYLPRQLSLAATLTVGVPGFFLALAPSSGAWEPENFVKGIARFALPAGFALALGVSGAYAASLDLFDQSTAEARTVATSTLVGIGLGFVIALEAGERRRLAWLITVLMGVSYVLVLVIPGLREFFALTSIEPDMLLCAVAGTAVGLGLFMPLWSRLRRGDDAAPPAQRPQTGQGDAPERA